MRTGKKTGGKRAGNSRTERILRFGVVGAGGMGQGYCQILSHLPLCRLAAVCDVNQPAAEAVGRQFGVAAFTKVSDLVASRTCDVVVVATPHPFHYQAALECMQAGLHALVEKPLTERISTADKLVATARQNGVVFAVMFQRRLEATMRKALEIIRAGHLGEIYRATLIVLEYRCQRYYDSGSWRATWRGEGGGVMMNQAPHMIDLFVQFCGLPSEVFGRITTRMHNIEVEDQAEALLKFSNGASGYLFCSTCEAGPGQMIEIFGEKGKLILRDGELTFHKFHPGIREHINHHDQMWGGPAVWQVPINIPGKQPAYADFEAPFDGFHAKQPGHAEVLTNMARHILFGEELLTPGASGLGSLELANAITLSSYEKRWISLPISRPKYDALLKRLQNESLFQKKTVQVERTTDPRLLKH